jgi:outer membrane protein assembly factor BamB
LLFSSDFLRGKSSVLLRLFICFGALTAAAPWARAETIEERDTLTYRPYRLDFTKLNPVLDDTKPVGVIDSAGFTANSGFLVGQFDQRWVGGLSLASRHVAWWLDGQASMTAPPGSFGSHVVLGFRDGQVMKVEAQTGKKIWSATLDSFTERSFLLNETTLYVLTAGQVLYAIDFLTGKTLWLFDAGYPEGLTIRGGSRPIFSDGRIIIGIASGEIIGVAADSGKLVWRYNPSYNDARFHDVVGDMVVRTGRLLMARYDGFVGAVDLGASARSVLWHEQLPGITTATMRGTHYYVGCLSGDLYALDIENGGKRHWRIMTGSPIANITAVGDSTLLVSGTDGRVTSIDASQGKILWHDHLGSALASPPALYENSIYYATAFKNIYSFKLK